MARQKDLWSKARAGNANENEDLDAKNLIASLDVDIASARKALAGAEAPAPTELLLQLQALCKEIEQYLNLIEYLDCLSVLMLAPETCEGLITVSDIVARVPHDLELHSFASSLAESIHTKLIDDLSLYRLLLIFLTLELLRLPSNNLTGPTDLQISKMHQPISIPLNLQSRDFA